MKYAVPVILTVATITVGIVTALAQVNGAFSGRTTLMPYLIGYGFAALLLMLAAVMAVVTSNRERGKPRVVAVRYGSLPEGHYGLTLANEGEPAYDVSVVDGEVSIGAARLKFPRDISRLTKEDGEVPFEAFIEISPQSSIMASGLFDQMRKNGIEAVTIKIIYKDGDNRWYKSVCTIERDVLAPGGLTTRFVRQRRAKLLGFLG